MLDRMLEFSILCLEIALINEAIRRLESLATSCREFKYPCTMYTYKQCCIPPIAHIFQMHLY